MIEQNQNILVVVNTDWFFLLHRVPIAKAFKNEGYHVIIAAKDSGKREDIEKQGFEFINIDFDRKGINPFYELKTIVQLFKLYKSRNIKLAYQVTIKPIIYGSIVSSMLKVKNINTVCGLGHVYATNKLIILKKLISFIYKIVLNKVNTVTFFENKDDLQMFKKERILNRESKVAIVNGAGVNLELFKPKSINLNKTKLTITLASRMLWNKGIAEFVEAARLLQKKYYSHVEFRLYGIIDKGNRESISEDYLNSIVVNDYLKWYGFESDMVSVYANSDVVTLPSYYGEGLPTVLAEACAMGLPIVTTDSVGCRECVDEGINGFKVPIRSVKELARAFEKLILNDDMRFVMGAASRKKAEKQFEQTKIVNRYLEVFKQMMNV